MQKIGHCMSTTRPIYLLRSQMMFYRIAWLNKIGHLQNLKSETDPKAQ